MNKEFFETDCPMCQAIQEELEENPLGEFGWEEWEDEQDIASNHVIDLILVGQLDAAETAAHQLLKDYPESVDGYDRLARVFSAKGDYAKAIQHFEAAIAFTRIHEGYDDERREVYREEIRSLQRWIPHAGLSLLKSDPT